VPTLGVGTVAEVRGGEDKCKSDVPSRKVSRITYPKIQQEKQQSVQPVDYPYLNYQMRYPSDGIYYIGAKQSDVQSYKILIIHTNNIFYLLPAVWHNSSTFLSSVQAQVKNLLLILL
jgi:hypothetical protein